jgi:hypothetical protein
VQRIVFGIVLFVVTTSTAEARKRPWDDTKTSTTIADVLPDVPVMDPNARAEAEKQRAIDEAFLLIDLDSFSDAPGQMASKPDPALLVAWRGEAPADRDASKVYLSTPAAPSAPAK